MLEIQVPMRLPSRPQRMHTLPGVRQGSRRKGSRIALQDVTEQTTTTFQTTHIFAPCERSHCPPALQRPMKSRDFPLTPARPNDVHRLPSAACLAEHTDRVGRDNEGVCPGQVTQVRVLS